MLYHVRPDDLRALSCGDVLSLGGDLIGGLSATGGVAEGREWSVVGGEMGKGEGRIGEREQGERRAGRVMAGRRAQVTRGHDRPAGVCRRPEQPGEARRRPGGSRGEAGGNEATYSRAPPRSVRPEERAGRGGGGTGGGGRLTPAPCPAAMRPAPLRAPHPASLTPQN